MQYFVYIVECSDNTFYTGSTNNLIIRLHQHNKTKKGARYTMMRRPVVLKYFEKFTTLKEARIREYELKKLPKKKKVKIIETITDLSEFLIIQP